MSTDRTAGSDAPRVETVRVFAAADRGMAMGHLDGKVAFIPFAAPGDVVEVEVVRERRRHVETRLLRVLTPSPLRRPPRCPRFGTCGGCQWQHLPYAEQLEAKRRSFQGFARSRLRLEEHRFRPPLEAPEEWGYRNRVGLKVRAVGNRVRVGFFARGSHRLVDVAECPVAHPRINALLAPLRAFLDAFPPARGFLPQVDVQVDGDGAPWVVVHLLRPLEPAESRALRDFLAAQGVAGTHLQAGRKATLAPLGDSPETMAFPIHAHGRRLRLAVRPGGFVQANASVNQRLVDLVADLAPLYAGETAVDLYCGAGNFTLPLALRAAAVVGVEGYPPAAFDAEANAAREGLDRVRVLAAPARRGLETLATEGARPRFALLDPPREGAREALEALAALGPEHLAYVSCAPPTLVRDLAVLRSLGYEIEWIRLADMFPQTAHVESLTLLRRTF